MSKDIDVIHHLGIIGPDLAADARRYERLGFILTPVSAPQIPLQPGGPPEPLGVGNRCIIFENNYLELLGVIDAPRWASITQAQRGPYDIDRPLSRYHGLHVLHLGTDVIEPVRERLLADGLQPSPIRPFQRLLDTPDGEKMMHAKCISFPQGTAPEALLQIVQHETPELVLQPRYMHHANGAKSITEVIVCVDDVESVAARYAGYTGLKAHWNGNIATIELAFSRVIITTPGTLPEIIPNPAIPAMPFLAGFTLAADLEKTRSFLNTHAIPYDSHKDRLIVGPAEACGTSILFDR
jgi:hypothetical protein